MSMGEWVVELDADLQVTRVTARNNEYEEPEPDPNNGPMGVMFANKMNGCIYDEWTAALPAGGWRPQSPKHTWAYARERYATDTWIFFTNAVDELGAFANMQAWLKSHD